MKKVIFKCNENMNQYEEEMEFDDDATEEDINKEWADWILQQVIDNYTWYYKK